MIFRVMQSALAATLVLVASLAVAGEPVDKALAEKLSKKLALPAMGLVVESVAPSQIPGLYEVQYANGGPLVYATPLLGRPRRFRQPGGTAPGRSA
jgi:hypothetical protein